jgi:hypothetical protein
MNNQQKRTFGAGVMLIQGAVTALFPQLSVMLLKKMLSKNFENTAQLEAKPEYLRQLRAIGVGIVAAAGTTLLLQSGENDTENSVPTEESTQSSA